MDACCIFKQVWMRARFCKTILVNGRSTSGCRLFVNVHLQARERFRQKETPEPAVLVAGGGIGSHDIVEDEDEAVIAKMGLFCVLGAQFVSNSEY